MTAFTTLMSQPPGPSYAADGKSTPQLSFVKYTLPQTPQSQDSVVTSESRGLLYGFGSTGFRTWEAALHLGTYLCCTETGQALIRGKRVLELGAGTGFVSLLCKKHLDAERMLMTDGNDKLVELFNSTCLKANELADDAHIQGKVWEWGTPLSQEENSPEQFDIAIGADVVTNLPLYREKKKRLT
jgi:ribosomal protein L11 methylase PrmA